MKYIKTFEQFINEKYEFLNEASAISPKDWDRMLVLVMKGDDGEKAAKLIKDKKKAIARFVTGLKLSNTDIDLSSSGRNYWGDYSALGDKALEMGATPEEIQKIYDETPVPAKYLDKMRELSTKKLDNWIVGDISKAVIDLGMDIEFIGKGGNATTSAGKDAMNRNGRKWTIGYKTEIDLGNKKVAFDFDAITDEGGGPSSFVLASGSDNIFNKLGGWDSIKKLKWIKTLKEILKDAK